MKSNEEDILLISLYVDDLIFIGNNLAIFKEFKQAMISEFEMIDNSPMSYFLGIEVMQSKKRYFYILGGLCEGDTEKI